MSKTLKTEGFTIIELMITVAVVGVLAAVALPSFNYTIKNSRVKTTASDLHSSLLYARSEAIKRNADVTVTVNSSGWVVSYVEASTTKILSQKNDVPSDVTSTCYIDNAAQSLPQSVVFNRSGRPDHLLEMRYFSSALSTVPMRCVSLSLSGRPKVDTDTDDDATNGCG